MDIVSSNSPQDKPSRNQNKQLIEDYCRQNGIDFNDFCQRRGIHFQRRGKIETPAQECKVRRHYHRHHHPEEISLVRQLDRAKQRGLPATLTLEQWLETLEYFQWKCAYCQQRPYQSFDHFIAISRKGGTTADNCIPTCKPCNTRKGRTLPENIQTIPRVDIERVRIYLIGRQSL